MNADRTLPWDWYPGRVPDNVELHPDAYLETTYSFQLFRSQQPGAVQIGRGASVYLGVMFDLGADARVSIGDFSLLNGSRIISNASVTIGDYCLISWNTVLMDTRRISRNPAERRKALESAPRMAGRRVEADTPGDPITIGNGVWIGFDSCVLPGVSIGDGSIVGARSVVVQNVPAYSIVVGNPARVIRQLDPKESRKAVTAAIAQFTPATTP